MAGELAGDACKVLMKCLWLGRLARPDIIKPIGDLATQVQKWSRNCDKALYRLICYIHSTLEHRLVGTVNDVAGDLRLRLYVDADFAGDRHDAKSTSGGYLVLYGDATFFPLAWICKKQTAVSRSTTEAEVISLAHSLFQEALPTLQLWCKILGRDVCLEVLEDNEATIKIVKKGIKGFIRRSIGVWLNPLAINKVNPTGGVTCPNASAVNNKIPKCSTSNPIAMAMG